MEWKKEQFRIVDDSTEISVDFVSRLLAETYWGHNKTPLLKLAELYR